MSELRSKYPQAKAWTFLLPDTPPSSGTAASRSVAARAGGCGRRAGPAIAKHQQQQQQRKTKSSVGNSNGVEMGSLCSSNKSVANKENMEESSSDEDLIEGEEQEEEETSSVIGAKYGEADGVDAPTVAEVTPTGVEGYGVREGGEHLAGRGEKDGGQDVNNGHAGFAEGMLDSTAFLSPDTVPAASVERKPHSSQVEGGAFFEIEQERAEDEGGDRSAWLARNLALLRGGRAVDVRQIKQVSLHY